MYFNEEIDERNYLKSGIVSFGYGADVHLGYSSGEELRLKHWLDRRDTWFGHRVHNYGASFFVTRWILQILEAR